MTSERIRLAFVCVRNAGRSQMAHALAERELLNRELENIDLLTGGTDPADAIHEIVVEAMAEVDIDLVGRTPRAITPDELATCDIVITMGCSAADVCPATWAGDSRDWALDDPGGADLAGVRAVRDEIQARVVKLFDELEQEVRSSV